MRFFHLADCHFGRRPGAGTLPAQVAEAVYRTNLNALRDVMARAATEKIDAVIIAGDLFDRPAVAHPVHGDVMRAIDQAQGVPVIYLTGNHDHAGEGPDWEHDELAPNLCRWASGQPQKHVDYNQGATIHGIGWQSRYATNPQAALAAWVDLDGTPINILALHGSLDLNTPPGWKRYRHLYQREFTDPRVTYVALGHSHYFAAFDQDPHAPIVYPGAFCPWGWDHTGETYYADVRLGDKIVEIEKVPSGATQFEHQQHACGARTTPHNIMDAYDFPAAIGQPKTVLRLTFSGIVHESTHDAILECHEAKPHSPLHVQTHRLTASIDMTEDVRAGRTRAAEAIANIDMASDDDIDQDHRALLTSARDHIVAAALTRRRNAFGDVCN